MKMLVVIAACNEAASLEVFLPRLQSAVLGLYIHNVDTRILIVDDGSTDQTSEVASKYDCIVLRNHKNSGIGVSLRRGYREAVKGGYDVVATMDADGQHSEKYLGVMIEKIRYGADIVVASRYHPESKRVQVPLDRDLLNLAVTAQVKMVTGWRITDPLSGFWMMRRQYFEFALKYGRQTRYGIHLEHWVKFWYLTKPRPLIVEVAHPAIYGNGSLLTRDYSPSNMEIRVERFGTHALHLLEALEDVRRLYPKVDEEIFERRWGK
jgi:glycosyltransferase involved in cell wall biosynthesis